VQFIVVKNLMPEIEGRVLTSSVDYKITGVADDEETSICTSRLRTRSVSASGIFADQGGVFGQGPAAKTRKEIETMGFKTNSTADTIAQIESLFANLRVVLGLLGMVALGVASLCMFNTLTVSLLERTREIGGMKTMGVVSDEIQDLFLAEAMIMGLGGGIGGLLLGAFVGKALSFGISLIAVVNGQGYLNLTYVPTYLTVFIMLSSFIVGIITGFYPAQRAKRISALNALRYE
jgi:ABC-type antimicrobial peptide transport system permease subunit